MDRTGQWAASVAIPALVGLAPGGGWRQLAEDAQHRLVDAVATLAAAFDESLGEMLPQEQDSVLLRENPNRLEPICHQSRGIPRRTWIHVVTPDIALCRTAAPNASMLCPLPIQNPTKGGIFRLNRTGAPLRIQHLHRDVALSGMMG